MSSLLCLPNELICSIANEVLPCDLDNFTMSCKHIRVSSEERLEEHRACKKLYGTLIFDRGSETEPDSVFAVLERLSLKPELVYYVKAVNFLGRLEGWSYRDDGSDEGRDEVRDRQITERTAGLRQLVLASPLIQEKELWCQEIQEGREECAFALLLSMLTNVRTVTIILQEDGSGYIDALLGSISQMQHHGACAPSALAKLHRLKLVNELDDVASIDTEQLLNWINLDTLRHLYASRVISITDTTCHHSDLSRIESLDLDECGLTIKCLERLLKKLPRLQDFRYQWLGPPFEGRPDFSPHGVCSLLSKYFSTTLLRLVLSTAFWPEWDIEPLSSFTNLKTVGLDVSACMSAYNRPVRLGNLLPPSVRNIQVRDDLHRGISGRFWHQFKDLKASLPNVKSLQIRGYWLRDTTDIEANCRQAGIRFERVPNTSC